MTASSISESIAIVHPVTLSHGLNAHVWDTDGKRYIDFVGGIGVLNLGHCHPRIVEAVCTQASRLTHYAFNAAPTNLTSSSWSAWPGSSPCLTRSAAC